MSSHKKIMFHMRAFYFFTFVAFGSLSPLLTVYLQNEVNLTGSQIGVIMSIGPIVMLISQPLWGMLSDYTRQPRKLLSISAVLTGLIGALYLFGNHYLYFIFIASILAIFQSAIVPLSDSIAVSYVRERKIDYGNIRLWGALGFAIAVWVMGSLSDRFGLTLIFYCYAIALILSGILAQGMPNESQQTKVEIKKGLKELIKIPRFLIFLLVTFLIYGPILANNFYFGIFIQFAGGSLAGVGFAFLLAAGSEVPFMRWAGTFIEKLGVVKVLFLASVISCLRWFFYATDPAPFLIYATTIAQGFSIGLFIPAALQYVSDIAPRHVRASAISIYSAVGNGLGAWFFTYIAGILIDFKNILFVYLFYGVMSLIGACLMLAMMRWKNK